MSLSSPRFVTVSDGVPAESGGGDGGSATLGFVTDGTADPSTAASTTLTTNGSTVNFAGVTWDYWVSIPANAGTAQATLGGGSGLTISGTPSSTCRFSLSTPLGALIDSLTSGDAYDEDLDIMELLTTLESVNFTTREQYALGVWLDASNADDGSEGALMIGADILSGNEGIRKWAFAFSSNGVATEAGGVSSAVFGLRGGAYNWSAAGLANSTTIPDDWLSTLADPGVDGRGAINNDGDSGAKGFDARRDLRVGYVWGTVGAVPLDAVFGPIRIRRRGIVSS